MVEAPQNSQEQIEALNTLENNLDNNLKQITKEIKDLIDTDENNDTIELAGKLTSEVANILKSNPDLAKTLSEIMDKISNNNQELNNDKARIDLQNFIKPYLTENKINNFSGDSISIDDTEGTFVNNFDNKENDTGATIANVTNLINILNGSGRPNDPIITELKTSLENIQNVLKYPNDANTKQLQSFLYDNLPAENKDEFKRKNQNNGNRDGRFGKATLNGLNIFLKSTESYINSLTTSFNIQKEHDNTVIETAEANRINNLKINEVMGPLLNQYNNDKINVLIKSIQEIESWDESEENKTQLQQTLNEKKRAATDLQNLLDNWNDQRTLIKNYLKQDGSFTRQEKDLLNSMFSDKAKENKQKELEDLNLKISEINEQLQGNKNEKISKKLSELEGEYKNMINEFNDSISKWQEEINAIPPYLKEQNGYPEKIASLNEQIKNKKNDIKNILEFFGWDDNCNLDNNTLGNTEYLNYKLSHESTEVNLENCINTISINDNFKLRGTWKELNEDDLRFQKQTIEEELNKYIDQNIRKYLPENVRIVLDLAQKALTSETNGDDKNVGVYALENKLAELGAMPRIANDGNNGVDGKFGPKTFDALTNYIETSLKENAEIQENGINVTLRGARSEDQWENNPDKNSFDNYEDFMIAIKGDIKDTINTYVKDWDNLSFNKKKILTLTKAALNAVSDGGARSDEVKALETELGMPDSPSHADIHDSIDGRFGPITYDALIKYLETPDN